MEALFLVLLLLGFLCFVLGTLVSRPWVDLLSLGLAFWILVPLLHQIQRI